MKKLLVGISVVIVIMGVIALVIGFLHDEGEIG